LAWIGFARRKDDENANRPKNLPSAGEKPEPQRGEILPVGVWSRISFDRKLGDLLLSRSGYRLLRLQK
jgi:hypothetical protein